MNLNLSDTAVGTLTSFAAPTSTSSQASPATPGGVGNSAGFLKSFSVAQDGVIHGTYSNGTSFNITSSVTWSATPGNKVKISSLGIARRLRNGQATIRATSGGVTGTTKVF